MKIARISVILLILTATSSVRSDSICSSSVPGVSGNCELIEKCTGAAISSDNCSNGLTCCLTDVKKPHATSENRFLKKNVFLKIAGNSTRNNALYYHFVDSMEIAKISNEFEAAAYLAQIIGETSYFKSIESSQVEADDNGAIGNNQTGDGVTYRGRGAILLRGKKNYQSANTRIAGLQYNILNVPQAAAFPSIAFKIAGWFWKENAYVIKDSTRASKSSLNELADGTFISFNQLTHSLTSNIKSLKERAEINEKTLKEMGSPPMKRGEGVTCELGDQEFGTAVPICLLDFKKSYCGCEGRFDRRSCPYGKLSNGACRNSAMIKCCVEKCYTNLDLVIMLDASGSVKLENFVKEKKFVTEMIDQLEVGLNATRVSIIKFAREIEVVTKLNNNLNKEQLKRKIRNIYYTQGGTSTHLALKEANSMFQEVNGMRPLEAAIPKVLITITDGQSNLPSMTKDEAKELKKREINMVSVGVGDSSKTELEVLSTTSGNLYYVDNFDKILTIINEISRTACYQSAEIDEEVKLKTTVEKDVYKYFRYRLNPVQSLDDPSENATVLREFSIGLEEIKGAAELHYSFQDNNPKSDSDFVKDDVKSDRDENFIDDIEALRVRRSFGRLVEDSNSDNETVVGNMKYYLIENPDLNSTLYFSLKGLEENNEIKVQVFNRTINTPSTINTTSSIHKSWSIYSMIVSLFMIIFINH